VEIVRLICIRATFRYSTLSETEVDNPVATFTTGTGQKFRCRFHESHIACTSCSAEACPPIVEILRKPLT